MIISYSYPFYKKEVHVNSSKELHIKTTTFSLKPELEEPFDFKLEIDLTGEDVEEIKENLTKEMIYEEGVILKRLTIDNGLLNIPSEQIYDVLEKSLSIFGKVMSIEEYNRFKIGISGGNIILKHLVYLSAISKINYVTKFIPTKGGVTLICEMTIITGEDLLGLEIWVGG